MLFLLSPAKALDYDTPAGDVPHTQPLFVKQPSALLDLLKDKSPQGALNSRPKTPNKPCWLLTATSTKAWMPKL